MSLYVFLLVIQAIIAVALVGVILMQRSEGGGLGVGGSPSGMMSARGAANFMTRATATLAVIFVLLSIALAVLAVGAAGPREIDTSLQRTAPIAPIDPLAPAAPMAAPPAAAPEQAPVSDDPLGGATQQ
jgi:preprotein translocase subunit SecG